MSRHATPEDGYSEHSVRGLIAHAIHDAQAGEHQHHSVLGNPCHRDTLRLLTSGRSYSDQINTVLALSPRRFARERAETDRAAGIEAASLRLHQEREACAD